MDVATHLMFQDGSMRAAVERYVTLVPGSAIDEVTGEDGVGQVVRFHLAGSRFVGFESPPVHDFSFTPATSIFVTCDTADEVDALFGALAEEGEVLMPLDEYEFSPRYGWCRDRHGMSWQVALG